MPCSIYYKAILPWFIITTIGLKISAQQCKVFNYGIEEGLPQNDVPQLMFDKNDWLWIGTQGGLCVFDGHKINQIKHNDLAFRIGYIHKDKKKKIYICDENQNIFQTTDKNYKLNKLNQGSETNGSWLLDADFQKTIKDISYKKHLQYYYTHNYGYKIFKEFGKNKSDYYIDWDQIGIGLESFFLLDTTLIGLTLDKKWIQYIKDHDVRHIKTDLPLDYKIKGFLFTTDYDTYWLHDHTIYKLKMVQNHLKAIPILKNVPLDPIKDKIISGQYNHKTGFFYFGSSTYGLYEVMPSHFKVKKPRVNNLDPLLLSSGYAYSQSEIDSSSIFVNNYTILRDTDEIVMSNIIKPNITAANMVDNKGWLWYNDDQYMMIKKGNKTAKISLAPLSNHISSISQLSPNRYLHLHPHFIIETDTIREIRRFDLGTFKNSDYEYGQYIYYEKSHDVLYLLTNRNIYIVNLNNGQITSEPSLKEKHYRIMQPLSDSISFVGTYGQGYLIKLKDQYVTMPLDKNENLKFAHAALCDSNGHVWISTNNGLFRTSLQDIIDYTQGKTQNVFYYYYDKSSGFLTNEFNGGCQSPAIRLKNGKLSFSSMDGLVQFDPLQVPAYFPNQPLQIVSLSLNEEIQDSIPRRLSITQDIKDIKLELSTAYYGHPDNLMVQYRIKGYVDEWKDLTDKRYIMLQNASHGKIQIEIRKRNGFGPEAYDYVTYPIQVLPYFYQTWWFIALLSVIGLSLAYIFSRWYSRYMIQKNKELEILILERNKEVLQTNEVLQEQVKQNDLFQSIFVHDIKSPIRFITSNTALLKTHWNHLDTTIKQDQISHIHDAATKIDHFIEETLLWIKIRNGELQLETNDFQALAMIQECIDFHKESDKIIRGDIQILADVHQDLYLTQDERLLATIIRNLISNSIKYTAHGKIIVYFLSKQNGSFTIGCKDTGKGMPKSLVEKLLSDHYHGNDIRDDSFKMGYVIIKEIVRLIGGQLHIESEENHGTHVWVEISNL